MSGTVAATLHRLPDLAYRRWRMATHQIAVQPVVPAPEEGTPLVAAPHPAPDELLVAAAQAGDARAFDELVSRHAGRVHGLVARLARRSPCGRGRDAGGIRAGLARAAVVSAGKRSSRPGSTGSPSTRRAVPWPASRVERHTRFCPRCRRVLANLRATIELLSQGARDDRAESVQDPVSDRIRLGWRARRDLAAAREGETAPNSGGTTASYHGEST